jgi:hypothetical protein
VRLYVEEIKAMVAVAGRVAEPDSELSTSLTWAMGYADRIDPVASLRTNLDAVLQPATEDGDDDDW